MSEAFLIYIWLLYLQRCLGRSPWPQCRRTQTTDSPLGSCHSSDWCNDILQQRDVRVHDALYPSATGPQSVLMPFTSRGKKQILARSDGTYWDDAMADNFSVVFVHGYPQRRERGKNHLKQTDHQYQSVSWKTSAWRFSVCHSIQTYSFEDHWLFIPHRIDGIALGRLGLKRFPFGVHRQAVHFHLHVNTDFLFRQELSGYDLLKTGISFSTRSSLSICWIWCPEMNIRTFGTHWMKTKRARF